jgi:hypothetical protein
VIRAGRGSIKWRTCESEGSSPCRGSIKWRTCESEGSSPCRGFISVTGRHRHTESGFGGVEVLPIGLLVMTIVTFVVLGAWKVIDAKVAVGSAATEAARTAVETFDSGKAERAGKAAWVGHGKAEEQLTVFVEGAVNRCGRITAVATSTVQPIRFPILSSWTTITVTSRHSALVDPYRNDLTGEAVCE